MKTRTPIEIVSKYLTTVETMSDAWEFVMEYIDELGDEPTVEIHPCWGVDDDDSETCHFHVMVEGCIERRFEEKDGEQ